MTDQRIVPLGSETDSSGLVSKFFMYKNAEHPAYPKFFVRKTSRASSGCIGLVRSLLSRARHEGVQEGLLNTQGNSAPTITFDFDKQSIEDQSFVRHLTSTRIVYILFRAVRRDDISAIIFFSSKNCQQRQSKSLQYGLSLPKSDWKILLFTNSSCKLSKQVSDDRFNSCWARE